MGFLEFSKAGLGQHISRQYQTKIERIFYSMLRAAVTPPLSSSCVSSSGRTSARTDQSETTPGRRGGLHSSDPSSAAEGRFDMATCVPPAAVPVQQKSNADVFAHDVSRLVHTIREKLAHQLNFHERVIARGPARCSSRSRSHAGDKGDVCEAEVVMPLPLFRPVGGSSDFPRDDDSARRAFQQDHDAALSGSDSEISVGAKRRKELRLKFTGAAAVRHVKFDDVPRETVRAVDDHQNRKSSSIAEWSPPPTRPQSAALSRGAATSSTNDTLGDHMFRPSSASREGPAPTKQRRRLGLPSAVGEALTAQIAQDADRAYQRVRDACVGTLDRTLLSPAHICRVTNESARSIAAQLSACRALKSSTSTTGAHRSSMEPAVGDDEMVDFHWFARRNIIFEVIAGVSADPYGLGQCAMEKLTEDQRVKVQAFSRQAKRGFPVGGIAPAERHPIAIIFEPPLGSEFDTVAPQLYRVCCRLKVLLVGHVKHKRTVTQSFLGHESNTAGRALLAIRNGGSYNARVAAEQKARQEARIRRDAEKQGINPHYLRTKPTWAAPFSGSIMNHSSDDLVVSATCWLDGPSPENGGAADSDGLVQRDGTLAAAQKLQFDPTVKTKSSKRVFPVSLQALLFDKGEAARQPLRQHKEVPTAKPLEAFIGHDELECELEYFVAYEEPEPALDPGNLLTAADVPPGGERPSSGTSNPGSTSAASGSRRKVLDISKALISVKDLKKLPPTPFSVIEYTTRWGVPVDAAHRLVPDDVWVRRWTKFPHEARTHSVPLQDVLDVCTRGSVSIDVFGSPAADPAQPPTLQYRHSFTFGPPPSVL